MIGSYNDSGPGGCHASAAVLSITEQGWRGATEPCRAISHSTHKIIHDHGALELFVCILT